MRTKRREKNEKNTPLNNLPNRLRNSHHLDLKIRKAANRSKSDEFAVEHTARAHMNGANASIPESREMEKTFCPQKKEKRGK
jgi:hypothetical protein